MGEYMARMAIDGSRSKVYRATSTTGNGHRGSIAGEDMLLLLLQTVWAESPFFRVLHSSAPG